jgi:hypothetical protein
MDVCSASEYPDPPAGHERVWEHPEQAKQLRAKISKESLEKRRNAEVSIVLILLSHKPEIDRADNFGATALFMAVDSN